MKHTRLALVLTMATLSTTPAFAASVTMLQFGSFETRDEAEKRLSEVTSKHTAEMGKLATSIREIKLPPDNLTVYRTQAGPVENRAAAQSICAKFASAGDECYIVQTAMVAASPAADSSKVAAAEAKSVVADVAVKPAEAATSATASLLAAANPSTDVPARDPLNRAALSSVNSALTADEKTADTASAVTDAATTDMHAALDKAVDAQPSVGADIAAASAEQARAGEHHSFWSRLNPFSDSAADVTPAVKTPELKETKVLPAAAPVEAVVEKPVEAVAIAAPVVVTPAPAAAPISKVPAVVSAASVITQAEPLRLPPPPAPLKAQDREQLSAPKTLSRPEPVAAPIAVSGASVNVEEAKRVPVTSTTVAPARTPLIEAVPVVKSAAPGVALSPSATEGQKTIWAQVGPFTTNEEALAFWANYRQSHPDFPVVRVRVTSPYQQQLRGVSQSWLRVGPMAQAGFVSNLCAGLVPYVEDHPSTLRCGVVGDLGVASPLKAAPGMLPASRYAR